MSVTFDGAPIEITDGTVITATHSAGAVRYVWRANVGADSSEYVVTIPIPASSGRWVRHDPDRPRVTFEGNRHARRKAAALRRRRP